MRFYLMTKTHTLKMVEREDYFTGTGTKDQMLKILL